MQKAIRYHEFGKPEEVLKLESIEMPKPKSGEVRVKLLAAAINPSDFGMIAGSYGSLRELPAVAGREAVGEVDALGDGVDRLKVGDRVRFPSEAGAWQAFTCAPESELFTVSKELPIDQLALSFINPPTAYCLLKTIVDLEPGDWVLQNAGNSAVGIAVIQIAKAFGLRTISQVRREELIEPLKALGADQVVMEGSGWTKSISEMTGGGAIRLALNSIGGNSAIDQIKVLGDGGTQVTFGGMVGEPVRFPTRYLIFNDIRMAGFWWDRWIRDHGAIEYQRVMDAVYAMMTDGPLELEVAASYELENFAEAIKHAGSSRFGKVLLKP